MARGKHEAPKGAAARSSGAPARSHAASEGRDARPDPAGVQEESVYDRMANNMPEAVKGFDHRNHSKKVRITLIVCSFILVLLLGALGYFFVHFMNEAQSLASDAASSTRPAAIQADEVADAGSASSGAVSQITSLPSLLGLTQDEALALIGEGAQLSSVSDLHESSEAAASAEGEESKDAEPVVIGQNLSVSLPERFGASSLYLTTDAEGIIVSAGCSAEVRSLGYGDVSFGDLVSAQHIVQNTLAAVGVMSSDEVVLPEDKADYTTYAEDGTTVLQESHTFKGSGQFDTGASGSWSFRLSYDYSSANVSGNLSDTIKIAYVSVSAAE